MKKLGTVFAAIAAAIGVWLGPMALGTAQVADASVCGPSISARCSLYWAAQITDQAYAGANNAGVAALQKSLQQAGYTIDVGTWGPYTTYTVALYQYDRGLPQTGTLTAETRAALVSGRSVGRAPGTTPPSTASLPAYRAVAYAISKLRSPYRFGSTGPHAFDCSGLTQASWRAAGVTIGRTTWAQYRSLPAVSRSALRPGDLVYFYGGGHTSIYVGDGYVIHSPRTGSSVSKVAMSKMRMFTAVRPRAWT